MASHSIFQMNRRVLCLLRISYTNGMILVYYLLLITIMTGVEHGEHIISLYSTNIKGISDKKPNQTKDNWIATNQASQLKFPGYKSSKSSSSLSKWCHSRCSFPCRSTGRQLLRIQLFLLEASSELVTYDTTTVMSSSFPP